MNSPYIIGIDLGTTNSALAYARNDATAGPATILPIPQLTAAATVETSNLLPSFLYLGPEHEAAAGAFNLPWGARPYAVGAGARRQAADVPTRTVAAAKSWLAHSRVNRREAILPWNAPADVPRVSPVTAARHYLEHLAAAWNAAFPDAPFGQQQVVLTVPASFDAAARELTREAALQAGLPEDLVLLEEPQAAVYAWLADHERDWRKQVREGDIILVCDVGGGTTDLTLIEVAQEDGALTLKRLAVGNHILVGGDNMDLAIAHHAQTAFAEKNVKLDAWQSVALWHACRAAKETLLADGGPEQHPVTILGRGRGVVDKSVNVKLQRADIARLLTEGFFPAAALGDRPARRAVSGFRELGLPFESDPAITRHLAHFLSQHESVRPTYVLFNGGVFKSEFFRRRLLEVMAAWWPGRPAPQMLTGQPDYDLAVARGAAGYGQAKQGRGIRIRGGTARAYYVGLETSGPAIPGAPRPLQALCVVPAGMEEGTATDVPGPEIGLVVGEPAVFRFFSSATRPDPAGALLTAWTDDELTETDSLSATLPASAGGAGDYVPVRFHARVTELGLLELWCASTVSDERWKLEFSVREND